MDYEVGESAYSMYLVGTFVSWTFNFMYPCTSDQSATSTTYQLLEKGDSVS